MAIIIGVSPFKKAQKKYACMQQMPPFMHHIFQ